MKIELGLGRWRSMLQSIGAEPSGWIFTGGHRTAAPKWDIILRTTGLEVAIEEIDRDQNGLFTYAGQRVLIYIKDTNQTSEVLLQNREQSRRFHFRDCTKIEEMKSANRFQRYVAIARTDGLFPVFSREEDNSKLALEAPLGPCKLCLKELDYKGYASARSGEKKRIWTSFTIDEFFERFPSTIGQVPEYQGTRPEPDDYPADWQQISLEVREAAMWMCDCCGVACGDERALLQVHHRNGVKRDVRRPNLRPLCALCHSEQPSHEWMYLSGKDADQLRRMRVDQGIRWPGK